MADGKTHTAATVGAAIGIGTGYACAYYFFPEHVPVVILGCLSGVLFGPDLDVDDGNRSDYYLRKIFKPLEWWWDILWRPYRIGVKHRSRISHLPIISTAIRLIFILFPIIINLTSDQDDTPTSSAQIFFLSLISQLMCIPFWIVALAVYFYLNDWQMYVFAFAVGLSLSDAIHYLFDIL